MPCFQMPKSTSSGIHHVAQAHMIEVTPSMKGRIEVRNGIALSVTMRTDPALVVIAAAPMTTHSNGRDVVGADAEEEDAIGEERDEDAG